ncbi:MAG TPA: tyrosine-type recombinase/integrase [Oligoflexus sp.]|uniref:tyrosine-type recombinase/integrase n=1 Tax=Oligoflexus sp. TaxID=1971216 RepID=UPI002D7F9106|nr:tyrosine-type recombinase/integrase [Oligoflexus sp.]HET9239228.1 tyrosine-type recombinase/integrase [Oligoflexus sp.]
MSRVRSNPNRPKKGQAIKVQPIRRLEDIRAIKRFLAGDPRNLAIFTLGINSALRASDLLRIRIDQVKGLRPGESFEVKEKKTGQYRRVMLNKVSHRAIQDWIQSVRDWEENDWLFPSRKSKGRLLVPTLTAMVKSWCRAINLAENYGSHTLRKTFGYQQRVTFGLGTAELMWIYNHSSERQTLSYLGIEQDEIRDVHWNAL